MDADVLRTLPLFGSLSKDARTFIADCLKTETFASGELIVRQGDTGDSLYIITNGLVKVTKRERTGISRELARFRAGDYFGEMSLLAGQPRSADIIAVTETSTLVLCKEDMDKILQEYPTIAVHFSKVLSKRLRDTSQLNLATKQTISTISIYSRHLDSQLQLVLAINLAASFSKELMKNVILIDASGCEEDLAHMLHLDLPDSHDQALFEHHDALDVGDIAPLIRIHKTGLHTLALGAGSKLKQRTFEKDITPLLEKLRQEYDYVLINCAKNMTRLVHSALDQADLIVYLAPVSDESIQRCKKDADLFIQGERDQHEILIGLIQDRHQSLVAGQTLEATLAPHAFMSIHKNTEIISHFLRTGRPFVFEHPKTNISQSLQHIVRRIGRVRVGLALGSGSARGFAHVGVLTVLEENGIPIDMIAGTSMGAFVGGFFAAGISAQTLEQLVLSYRDKRKVRRTIFDLTVPLYGLSKGTHLSKFMRGYLKEITFDELPIPFAAIATDIGTGQEIVLRHGVLWEALRASGSVPVMFEPYHLDDRYLVDGGITNPLPTDVLIENDIDFIISCSVNAIYSGARRYDDEGSPTGNDAEHGPEKPSKNCTIFNALARTLGIMSSTNTLNKARLADVDIRPDVSYIDWTDFHRGDELLQEGREAAEKAIPAILELLREKRP